ncbi:MAG TPA: hypothetical protein VKT26_05095, partial [Acetobacteraceae bacterium]|nr:hypothetical protein [Acetobacteraceae bacterium]
DLTLRALVAELVERGVPASYGAVWRLLKAECQIACNYDPHFAFNRDPLWGWFRLVPVANRRDPRGAE